MIQDFNKENVTKYLSERIKFGVDLMNDSAFVFEYDNFWGVVMACLNLAKRFGLDVRVPAKCSRTLCGKWFLLDEPDTYIDVNPAGYKGKYCSQECLRKHRARLEKLKAAVERSDENTT